MKVASPGHQMLRAALAYAERLDWAVFPCSGKVPAIRGGRGCLDATKDVALIRKWWGEMYPKANIGVATGSSSRFWVLDVDGEEGEAALAELVRKHGPLPETVEQLTGGGGRHLLFLFPGVGIKNAVRFAPGLDVRSTGGYIVVAPSVHPQTSRIYAWEVSAHPLDVTIKPAPPWLFDVIDGKPCADVEPPAGLLERGRTNRPGWLVDACGVVPSGKRNDTLTRVAGHLLRRCDPLLAAALASDWNARHCQPPLPEGEVARTLESIAARELRRISSRLNRRGGRGIG